MPSINTELWRQHTTNHNLGNLNDSDNAEPRVNQAPALTAGTYP